MGDKSRRRAPGNGHVAQRKLKSGRTVWLWKATVTVNGKHVQRMRSGFPTKTAAEAALRQALTESDAGQYREPSKLTFGAWFAKWLPSKFKLGASSRQSYAFVFAHYLEPRIGSVPLAELGVTEIATLWGDLLDHGGRDGRPLSAATVMRAVSVVSGALEAARKAKLIAENPVRDVESPEVTGKEAVCWTEAQADDFLAWCDQNVPERAAMWRTYARTGCRRGELLALKWDDISAKQLSIRRAAKPGPGRTVEIGTPKNNKNRAVLHYLDTHATLKAHKAARGALLLSLVRDDALIFSDENGHQLHPLTVTQMFNRDVRRYRAARGDAAPPRITLHGLRHAHGSHLLNAGVPNKVVAERLGHTVATLEKTYSHEIAGSQEAWLGRAEAARYTRSIPGASDAL